MKTETLLYNGQASCPTHGQEPCAGHGQEDCPISAQDCGKTRRSVRVRRVEKRDIPAIAAIERACFSEPWSETAIDETLSSPYAYLVCAVITDEESGEEHICAYGGLYFLGGDADITNIATLPAYRRQGLARAVLMALVHGAQLHFAQEKRCGDVQSEAGTSAAVCEDVPAIHLEVRASNEAAMALYEAFGFVRDGVRRRYYKNPIEDAVLMSRVLKKD